MPKLSSVVQVHSDAEMCRDSQEAIEFIGRRWVGVVLIAGYLGARRFSEYRRFAVGISDRVLTQRLRELEQRQLLERTVVPTMPVQITYTPTARGQDLVLALQPLFAWWLEGNKDQSVRGPAASTVAELPRAAAGTRSRTGRRVAG